MSALSGLKSASDIQMDYMKLLVTQLRNQNPMEPLDNNDMASQLAQFSSLQQLESISSNFSDVLSAVEQSYGSGLIGKEVRYFGKQEDGEKEVLKGVVQGMFKDIDDNNKVKLVVDENIVELKDIVGVSNNEGSAQLDAISSGFDYMLGTVQRDYANSLIGREVTFGPEGNIGTVERVFEGEQGLRLVVDSNELSLSDITGVNI